MPHRKTRTQTGRRPGGFCFCTPERVVHVLILRDATRLAKLAVPREVDLRALHNPLTDAHDAIVEAIRMRDQAGKHCLRIVHGKKGGLTEMLALTVPLECCLEVVHRPGHICKCHEVPRAITLVW